MRASALVDLVVNALLCSKSQPEVTSGRVATGYDRRPSLRSREGDRMNRVWREDGRLPPALAQASRGAGLGRRTGAGNSGRQGYAADLCSLVFCAWISSSKMARYWIMAARSSSVVASGRPLRTATAWARR